MYNILVQFPGTPKEYAYTCPTEPALGQRCVVPTMIKKDGTVALSIATIVGFGPETVSAKPVIALLDSALIAAAQEFVLKLEVPAKTQDSASDESPVFKTHTSYSEQLAQDGVKASIVFAGKYPAL